MKKLLLTSIFAFAGLIGMSQTVKRLPDGNYVSVKSARNDSVTLIQSKDYYTDSKGVKYPVLLTSKNRLVIIRTSKKTGKTYKQYLNLEK